jgi:hypothetical protein
MNKGMIKLFKKSNKNLGEINKKLLKYQQIKKKKIFIKITKVKKIVSNKVLFFLKIKIWN